MANKTIQQLIASGALIGSTTFETQLAGGGASQFGTLTQLLTFIQGNANAFTQDPVTFSGTVNFSVNAFVNPNGAALFANGFFRIGADGSLSIGFGPGAFLVSTTGVCTSTQDIEITDTTKGYILKSPNGTRYRIKVSDVGVLTTQAA